MSGSALTDLTHVTPSGMTEGELARLSELLAVPSISVRSGSEGDMRAAAELCVAEIERADGQARVVETTRHPLVTGTVPASNRAGSAPRVLIYGHYDVQAVDPIEDWVTPPFEPTVRDGYLYCRGANDDKGQLFMLLLAVQRLRAAGELTVNVSFLIDGEEEIGGTSAPDYVAAADEELTAAVIFDAPMLAPQRPAFYVAARGLVSLRVNVRTGSADAHSGHFGGAALNAAHALMRALTTVIPADGPLRAELREGVAPVTQQEQAAWRDLPSGPEILRNAGLVPADATAEEEFYPRTVAAPALDVHSLTCGGPRPKTVVVTEASATLSLRLAPGQRAERIGRVLGELIHEAAPAGADIHVEQLIAADPALIDPDAPVIQRALDAVRVATGLSPSLSRLGGTVPVLASLADRGIPTVLTGFHDADDGTHAPNERIRLEALATGLQAATAILSSVR